MKRSLVLLCAVLASACSTTARRASSGEPRRSSASELIFSHAKHLEQGAACEACHAGVAQSDKLGTPHRPRHAQCGECHEEVKDRGKCAFCHRDLSLAGKAARRPPEALTFSHRRHAPRVKDCVRCHSGAAVATSVEEITRPKMRGDCFECHNHLEQYRKLTCRVCHQSLSQYPIRFVSSFNHEGNFLREHGRWARTAGGDLCASCHGQSYCADCHSQQAGLLPGAKRPELVDRQFIHRGDWVGRHAMESRGDPGSCMRCHSPKRCDKCHQAEGVSARAGAGGPRSPHPADWLSPGSPNSHGPEARRRITQCASCHDQGHLSNCVRCHRSARRGGLGINPHPPGWDRGGRSSNSTCTVCH
jgi:hypothetical protein